MDPIPQLLTLVVRSDGECERLRELLEIARSGLLAVFECEGTLPEGVRFAAWRAREDSDPDAAPTPATEASDGRRA